MKVSRNWLQTFFGAPLPDAQALADALTFHAFEIERLGNVRLTKSNIEDSVLDVKVTPNRGHDCLSHRGIAKEISAILNIPIKNDPLTLRLNLNERTDAIKVSIDTPLCARYIAGYIRGVKVGPSPAWLRENLESIGQKSINNIVDAANYVMFHLGQPLHAFDAQKLGKRQKAKGKSELKIQVRNAKKGQKMLALDGKEYTLNESMLVIADGNSDKAVGIAGVKGGKTAEVNETTTDIIIESANFDGASVRKTAQALKLRTDASERFQQGISPELAAYGLRAAADSIAQLAGGEPVGSADAYPRPQQKKQVSVSVARVNQMLGTSLGEKDILDAFIRLGLPYKSSEASPRSIFKVDVPFERLDIEIPEDLVEEIARIEGYDKIPSAELPTFAKKPETNQNFCAAEKAREELIEKGYSEVFTSVFADKGGREVLNKVGGERPYLRATLTDGLREALEKNKYNKDILGLAEIRLFEIGTVWRKEKEEILLGIADEKGVREELLKSSATSKYENLPISGAERYKPFSKYPVIVRDISLWVFASTTEDEVIEVILRNAGKLLRGGISLFDTFKKEGKKSYTFRLVFQSFEKTLTDEEANAVMESVYKEVKKRGWEVR